jgi:glucosamine-phosphate N-acetyltransferase
MINFEKSGLKDLVSLHSDRHDELKTSYIELLSQLTTAENISTELFLSKIEEIHKMGDIIVCYHIDDENNMKIIGSGTVIYEPKMIHSCKYVGHIEDIVVHNEYRSLGIAKNIIDSLVKRSFDRNCYKVILDCKDELCGFYQKQGFNRNGSQMSLYQIGVPPY